jgi:hypothetical protein
MSKCPFHKEELIQSKYNASSYVCNTCKKEKSEGLRSNDGIWHESQLDTLGSNISSDNKEDVFYLFNNREVYGVAVHEVLEEVFGLEDKEIKRIIFEAHAYGKAEIPNCSSDKKDEFHSLLSAKGYSQKILDSKEPLVLDPQDINDLTQASPDLEEDDWDDDEF